MLKLQLIPYYKILIDFLGKPCITGFLRSLFTRYDLGLNKNAQPSIHLKEKIR